MKRLFCDFENNAEVFWDAVRQEAEAGNENAATLDRMGTSETIDLDDAAAATLLAYAETLPGWHGGPDYADTPIVVQDC